MAMMSCDFLLAKNVVAHRHLRTDFSFVGRHAQKHHSEKKAISSDLVAKADSDIRIVYGFHIRPKGRRDRLIASFRTQRPQNAII